MLLFALLLLSATPAPTPTDTVTITGELDPRVIQRGVKRHMGQIQTCYQDELDRVPSLEGDLSVRFEIGPDGHARNGEIVRSTLSDPTVEQCVVDVFDRMTFPRPAAGGLVKVTFPLRFSTDR